MSVHDAQCQDVYVDKDGKLWRVLWTCREPTVCVVEIEKSGDSAEPVRLSGGVSGLMWNGFARIFRPKIEGSST